jgi:hypothetical protein
MATQVVMDQKVDPRDKFDRKNATGLSAPELIGT